MTGAEQYAIAAKALRWQIADQRRRDLRQAWHVMRKAGTAHETVIAHARRQYISAAMSCGGHKRGLLTMCAAVNSKGVDR